MPSAPSSDTELRGRLPKEPLIGFNDWYAAYGRNTATNFLAAAAGDDMVILGCNAVNYLCVGLVFDIHSRLLDYG